MGVFRSISKRFSGLQRDLWGLTGSQVCFRDVLEAFRSDSGVFRGLKRISSEFQGDFSGISGAS